MLIGYARVSRHEQNLDLQLDALKVASCERIFTDEISGAKSERPGLADTMNILREGDTLIVWKLDRLGRSLKDLVNMMQAFQHKKVEFKSLQESIDTTTPMGRLFYHFMAALAEYERELIIERTKAGLASARARGRMGGRPKKLSNGEVVQLQELFKAKAISVRNLAKRFNISVPTLYKYVNT